MSQEYQEGDLGCIFKNASKWRWQTDAAKRKGMIMGLMDRDYMRERNRRASIRSDPRMAPYVALERKLARRRATWWTLGVCAAIYLTVKYLVLPAGGTAFPVSGQPLWFVPVSQEHVAPLNISAPIQGDKLYAVRIHAAETGHLVALVPLRRGETASLSMPLGQYEMVFASGSRWYGPEDLFGFMGKEKKAVKVFQFYRTGNQTMGHNIDLTNRLDGNLPTRAVLPFEK